MLRERVEALRSALVRGFRGEPIGGSELRRLADRLVAAAGDEAEALRRWAADLAAFDGLEDDGKAVELARGLRLCREIGGAPRAPRPSAPASASPLDAPVETLPGFGPATAARLADRGIERVGDLLFAVPRRYDDARAARRLVDLEIDAIADGERATLYAEVESVAYVRRGGRKRWLDVRFGGGDCPRLMVRFFGAYPSLQKKFPEGAEVVLSGRLGRRGRTLEMANPDVIDASGPQILVRYPQVPGVSAAAFAKAAAAAVDRAAGAVKDAVPAAIRERHDLAPVGEALSALHRPPESLSVEEVASLNRRDSRWHRRLAFEEMFVLAVQVMRRRRQRRSGEAPRCPRTAEIDRRLEAALPFELTSAQARAIGEIADDLAGPRPMNRLLQGDVGSGKTAVAFAAACQVAAAGAQVALMAPTEILAEQHAAALGPWCERAGLRSTLLTASVPAGVKRSRLALIGAGEIDLIVGTHALIAESVAIPDLGLAIVDEQHRFGVAQRVALRRKGTAPHLLVMTATPIPRSLALSVYGDLDVSVIDELPPGRTPPATHVLEGDAGRVGAYKALLRRLESGEQGFVVCPLVEPSEATDWRAATAVAEELRPALAPHPVGLVHGRLGADERAAAMRRFRDGTDRVLVATTVIEVGVDVPSATVMIVEDADHFGLAQLHQLRGRIGRGGGEANCALLHRGRISDDARRRLQVMAETSDGFRIAEEDLDIRGPGELLGARQAGLPALRFGDLRQHLELLSRARELAAELIESDPGLEAAEHRDLRAALERIAADDEVFDAESG